MSLVQSTLKLGEENRSVPENLEVLSDEELAQRGSQGCTEAVVMLIRRYKFFLRAQCNGYFLIGAGREDLMQEALIGLYKAIRDFDVTKTHSFRPFAALCVKRQIITAIKTASRQKHIALNSFISFDKNIDNGFDTGRTLLDVLVDPQGADPVQKIILQEELCEIQQRLNLGFSQFEFQALLLYLQEYTYAQIATELKVREKAVTNCMYRVQKKLKRMYTELYEVGNR